MKEGLLQYLCCPSCHGSFRVEVARPHGHDIVDGTLRCTGCGRSYPIRDGIPVILEGKALRDFSKTKANWENWWRRIREKADIELYDRLWTEAEQHLGGEPLFRKADFAGKTVLDAGCGNGRHLREFARYGAKDIVAIDLGRQVFFARANNKQLANVHYVQGDITNPPFKDGGFDLIASHGVLHHTPQPAETFQALARCLRDDGLFALYVYHKEWAYFKTHRKSLFLDTAYAAGVMVWQTIRKVTSRLPHPLLLCFCYCMATKASIEHWLERHRITRPLGQALRLIPPFAYLGVNFHERLVRNYDHYSATFNYFFTVEEVVEWFRENGFDDLTIASIPVSIRGYRRRRHPTAALHITAFPLLEHFRFRAEWERLYSLSKDAPAAGRRPNPRRGR